MESTHTAFEYWSARNKEKSWKKRTFRSVMVNAQNKNPCAVNYFSQTRTNIETRQQQASPTHTYSRFALAPEQELHCLLMKQPTAFQFSESITLSPARSSNQVHCLGNPIILSIVHHLDNIIQRNSTATNSCRTITCHIHRRTINARNRISPTCIQTYATLPTSHNDGYDRDAIINMLAKAPLQIACLNLRRRKHPMVNKGKHQRTYIETLTTKRRRLEVSVFVRDNKANISKEWTSSTRSNVCHNNRFLHCTITGFFQREPNLKRLSINSEHQDCVERDMVKSQHTGLLGSKAKNNHKSTNAQLDNKQKKTRHAWSPKRAGKNIRHVTVGIVVCSYWKAYSFW